MPATRHLDIYEDGDITIVRFRDPRVTDPLEIEDMGRQLYQVLEFKNCSKLVLELSPVEFLSSAMIGKLISLHRKAKGCKATMRLCGLQQGVRDIFHLCNLDRVFDVREDERAAIASFA
jgi:anti-sigma B factor antagonist